MTYCLLTDYILVCGFRLASGDVASKVVIEKRMESVMAFYKGSGDFYLGYVTLKVLSLSVCLSLLQQSLTLVQYITISFFQFSCLAFVTCHGENNLVIILSSCVQHTWPKKLSFPRSFSARYL